MIGLLIACKKDDVSHPLDTGTVVNVDAANFLTSTGSVVITTENRTLSNGTTALVIKL